MCVYVLQAQGKEASVDDGIKALKAEAASLHKEVGKAEKEQAKRRKKLEALAPEKIKEEQAIKVR